MKGLWIKDMKLLKNQKSFFMVIAAICLGFLLTGQNPSSVICYAAVMFSILVITTIGYDEQNNGLGFLLTLPVSREMYVLEKYLLGIVMPLVAIAAGMVLSMVFLLIRPLSYEPEGLLLVMLVSLLISVIMQSVTIPVQLKFGAEKSRIAMLLVTGCIALFAYLAVYIAELRHVAPETVTEWIAQANPALLAGCGAAAAVMLMGISYVISLQIMKRKQF